MSLKSELSADRAKKMVETQMARATDLVEMPKKIYEYLLDPAFRVLHASRPLERKLQVEITTMLGGFEISRTFPELSKGKKWTQMCYTGLASEKDILKALCERAKEFELEAYPNKERDDRASFVLELDDLFELDD